MLGEMATQLGEQRLSSKMMSTNPDFNIHNSVQSLAICGADCFWWKYVLVMDEIAVDVSDWR